MLSHARRNILINVLLGKIVEDREASLAYPIGHALDDIGKMVHIDRISYKHLTHGGGIQTQEPTPSKEAIKGKALFPSYKDRN